MFSILQVGAYDTMYADQTSGLFSSISTSGSMLLMVIIAVVGYIVQARLQSVFQRYSQVYLKLWGNIHFEYF